MAKKTSRQKRGAFLIELLIAIAIMAVFSATAVILVWPQIVKARDAKVKEDLIQIRNALTQYSDDNGCFPQNLPACGQDFQKGNTIYFKSFPCTPNGTAYSYQTDNKTCNTWYMVLANLENTNDKSIDLIGCRSGCGLKCDYNYGVSSSNVGLNQGCPQIKQNYYACGPSGNCILYANPAQSQCPKTFINDPTCQDSCSLKANKCHDESGKQN